MSEILDEPNSEEHLKNLPGKLSGLKYRIELAEEQIQRAVYFLLFLTGITLVRLILFLFEYGASELYAGHLMFGGLFLLYSTSAISALKKPLLGISFALFGYILFHIGLYFFLGIAFLDSWIFKGVTLFFLGTGFVFCFKANKMKADLDAQIRNLELP